MNPTNPVSLDSRVGRAGLDRQSGGPRGATASGHEFADLLDTLARRATDVRGIGSAAGAVAPTTPPPASMPPPSGRPSGPR